MSSSTLAPAAEKRVSRTTQDELLHQILQHEREFRNINWLEELFDEQGNAKPDFVGGVVAEMQASARPSEPGQQDAGELEFASFDPNVKLVPVLSFTPARYNKLRNLRGDAVKEGLLQIIVELQEAERRLSQGGNSVETMAKLVGAGIVGVGVKAAFTVIGKMWAGETLVVALEAAGVTLGLTTLAVIGVIVVVLVAFALVMMKEAREIHLVLNNTDYDLVLNEVYTHHGKENFRPADDNGDSLIPARMPEKNGVGAVYGGFFGASKCDGALVGATGAIRLDLHKNGRKHGDSTYLGYCVPLLGFWSGGDNGGLARCNTNESARDWYKREADYIEGGNLESSNQGGNIHVRKCVASKSGSQSFAITCYNQS